MFKDTITYTDYDNNTQTDDLYFNLNKVELTKLMYSVPGGLDKKLEKILDRIQKGDVDVVGETVEFFEDLIKRSYGVKSDDGKRFIKSDELTEEFVQSEAYSEFFTKMFGDANLVNAFINGVLPTDVVTEITNSKEYQDQVRKLESGEVVSD